MASNLTARQAAAKVRRALPGAKVTARTTREGAVVTVRDAGELDDIKLEVLRYAALWGGFAIKIVS